MNKKEKILEAKEVYKIYRGRPVIRKAALTLRAGECVLITGDNSSGKTTLIRLLSGMARPTMGTVWLHPELSKQFKPADVEKDIGLSAFAFLFSLAKVDGYSSQEAKTVCRAMFAHYHLSGLENVAVSKLSDSVYRKLMLAQAMLKPCDLLFMDEPFIGLDHDARKLLFADMMKLKQQNTAILMACSHRDEIEGWEALVDKIWHIEHGEIKEKHNEGTTAL
ncbi:MAG: ATP-binding cassette domain-containing protein [Lachnospiraceae bacterium]|nr:ATP-binding cassette domain-containing protein [Lachnospiraceae bacterium]MBD5482946.1 ATP-binding cassette domain-containing protein [Lachnospiraceae bacterium]